MATATIPLASHQHTRRTVRFLVAAAVLPVALVGCGTASGPAGGASPTGATPSITVPASRTATPQTSAPQTSGAATTPTAPASTPTVGSTGSASGLGDLSRLTLDGIGNLRLGLTRDQALKLGALVNSPGACEGDHAMAPALASAGIGLNFSRRTDGSQVLAMITVSKPGVRLNGTGEVGLNESEIRAALKGELIPGQLTTEGRGPIPVLILAGQATEVQVFFDASKVTQFQLRKAGERFAWDGC